MSYYSYDPYSNELYHIGVKRRSGRYPYGSGDNPYQRLNPAARLRLMKTKIKSPSPAKAFRDQRKQAKAKAKEEKNLERAKEQAERERANVEEQKKRVLATRNPTEIYKHADLFSKEELDAIYIRLSAEKKLLSIEHADVTKGKIAVDKILRFSNKANDLMSSGVKFYNNALKVNQIFNNFSSGHHEPITDKKKEEKKKKEDDD